MLASSWQLDRHHRDWTLRIKKDHRSRLDSHSVFVYCYLVFLVHLQRRIEELERSNEATLKLLDCVLLKVFHVGLRRKLSHKVNGKDMTWVLEIALVILLFLPDINRIAAAFHLGGDVHHFVFSLFLIIWRGRNFPIDQGSGTQANCAKFGPGVLKTDSIEAETANLNLELLI